MVTEVATPGSAPLRVWEPVAVAAGYPSPAQDYDRTEIDLVSEIVKDKTSTFFLRVAGESMSEAGISDGDVIVVDRSLTPASGDVVVAVLDGMLTVKRLDVSHRGVTLRAENRHHPDIVVDELSELTIWGVVTTCLHHLRAS
nr:S24 family peptidase [Rarobacter faecitabidus]